MAVTTTTTKEQFAGDNVTSIFPVTSYKIYATSEITVQVKNTSAATVAGLAAGATALLVLTTDYTVALGGSATGVAYTFTVTVVNTTYDNLPTGLTLIIRRILPRTQTTSLADNTPTPANTYQQMHDREVMLVQQQQEILDRVVLQDINLTTPLTLPAAVTGTVLGWSAGAIINLTPNAAAYLTKASAAEVVTGTDDAKYVTPAGVLAGQSSVQTLTNKRITKRVYSVTTLTTLTPEISAYDIFHITALASALTIANKATSVYADGDRVVFRFLDNATARALTWGTDYVAKGGVALPTTTTLSKNIEIGFEYNSNLAKLNLLAVALEA